MNEMAACHFEGDGGHAALCNAIRMRLTEPPPEPPGIDAFNILVAAAFTSLDFIERGC